MEETLQHETTTQCLGLPPTGPGNHRPDGTQANNALTFKLDHSSGADHDELQTLADVPSATLKSELSGRKEERSTLLNMASPNARLTLRDLELLSAPRIKVSKTTGGLNGSCVSGTGRVLGKVFKVDPTEPMESAFRDFQDGDVIVCSVIDPNWLPYVQKSSGVLAEVGGWLSHMAIIAREAGVMMLVKCNGIMSLQTGQRVSLSDYGIIEVVAEASTREA